MAILASYDEAFGPSNPHTTRHHEDFSWGDEIIPDDHDLLVLMAWANGDEAAAADLWSMTTWSLTSMHCDKCEKVITPAQATWLSDDCPVCSTCAQVTVGA